MYYVDLKRFSFTKKFYCYVDIPDEYFADFSFRTNGIQSIKFVKELRRKDSKYCIVFCEFKKKELNKFLDAMNELPNRMNLLGFPDYLEEAEKIFDGLEHLDSVIAVNLSDDEKIENPDTTTPPTETSEYIQPLDQDGQIYTPTYEEYNQKNKTVEWIPPVGDDEEIVFIPTDEVEIEDDTENKEN